ncbi:MAG: hypothetical protein ACR2HQ_04730 [Ilumatobacteraceae bacterium]
MSVRKAVVCAVAVLALGACGGADDDDNSSGGASTQVPVTAEEGPPKLEGAFVLQAEEDDVTGGWSSCSGQGGYNDFKPGMNVTVRDQAGTIVGSGSARALTENDQQSGRPELIAAATFAESVQEADVATGATCVLAFSLDVNKAERRVGGVRRRCCAVGVVSVPVEFYAVEIGSRSELTYSLTDLEAQNWWVELSLGD